MKKRYPVIAGILSVALLLAAVGCGDDAGGGSGSGWYDKDIWMNSAAGGVPTAEYTLPTEGNFGGDVAVHDPSVFYDDVTQKYYAFGTHFAVASSTDLIKWTQEASDSDSTVLFGSDGADKKLTILKETLGITGNIDTWAPDVMKIGNMYYMYLSATAAFGSNRSGIVRVRANNVMGPYREEEKIVFSSMGGDPNCIDPELFYDKEGKLWMVYGSFFAGIYIKELDEKGLPKEEGFGKLLWKGNSTGVEGPFIFYNQELDYYYLMTSDGSLSSNYNMRVARSKNPDGPYTDITGKDMAQTAGLGTKLTGNYKFSGDQGYAALGHNSVIKKDGKYLVVHHLRWEDDKGGVGGPHRVEVRQLFFNEEEWPVLSPNRYVGEQKGAVTQEKAAGDYDVVVHKTYTDAAFVPSVRYTFTADGKIMSGETEAGTWSVSQNYYVKISLGGVAYSGVIAPAWRNYGPAKGALCMTAISATGGPLWINAA